MHRGNKFFSASSILSCHMYTTGFLVVPDAHIQFDCFVSSGVVHSLISALSVLSFNYHARNNCRGDRSFCRLSIPGTFDILVQGRLGDVHHLTDLADCMLFFVAQFHNQIPLVPTQRPSSSALLIILVGNKGPKFCRGPSPR